jgi:aminoglycoside phosphotransferase (APT) family kinase protein
MLSDSDASLIARDPSVTGLKLLLDSDALFATLAEKLPQLELVAADTEYLRYKPGVSCLARIRLHTRREKSSAYAMAYQRGAHNKLRKAAVLSDESGATPILLPEHSIVVYPFPLDRRLPALGRFMHRSSILELVRRAAPRLMATKEDVSFRTLRYKPERRYVAQLAEAGQPFAALKMYSAAAYQRARRAAKTVGGAANLSHARCIGHSARHGAIVFDWVDGAPLSEVANDIGERDDVIRQAASALHCLHGIRGSKLPAESMDATLHRLRVCAKVLAWLAEDLADQVQAICDTIGRRLLETPPRRIVPIHGDLHLKQFVVGDDGPRLLDFDRARRADPAEDLGSLLGNLRRRSINSARQDTFDALFQLFLGQYEAAGGEVDTDRIHLFAAFRLIELAVEPFRNRRPGWIRRIPKYIEAAEQILEAAPNRLLTASNTTIIARPAGEIEVVDPFDIVSDERLPGARDAIDPRTAQQRLETLACCDGEHSGITVSRIHVTRHKPGRRCVIEYAGRSPTTGQNISLIGKINAKERHQRHFDWQRMLWHAGFEASNPDGVSVARPWGLIPEWKMWLLEKVRGQTAWGPLQSSAGPAVARRIAAALAKLHDSDVTPKSTHTIDAEMAILQERLTSAAAQVPHLAGRIFRVLDGCQRKAAAHVPGNLCPVHRDFYPDQVLVDGERIVMVDFDLLSWGEAAVDVGNFCAHLIDHGLRHPRYKAAYAACTAAFESEYVRRRPSVTAAQISTYAVLSLARHVSLCMSRSNHNANMLRILDTCEAYMNDEPAATIAVLASPVVAVVAKIPGELRVNDTGVAPATG